MPWAFAALVLLLAAALVLAHRSARATRDERSRLIEQQQRAELLVRATQAGLFEWEANSDRTSYSERLKEMLGYPADTDTSKWPLFFEFIHPEDRDRVRNLLLSQLRDRYTELPTTRNIWISCGVGQRAYYATRFLVQHGYRAWNLSGGYATYRALRDAGLTT